MLRRPRQPADQQASGAAISGGALPLHEKYRQPYRSVGPADRRGSAARGGLDLQVTGESSEAPHAAPHPSLGLTEGIVLPRERLRRPSILGPTTSEKSPRARGGLPQSPQCL